MSGKIIRSRKGLTLIEMIITIVVIGIISAVVGPILYTGVRSYVWTSNITDVNSQAQLAVERMSRELRNIQSSYITSTISNPATTLTYNPGGGNVTYSLSGNQLLRNSSVLASNVTGLQFNFYRDDGSVATVNTEVWRIQILLNLALGQATQSLQTSVFLRSGPKDRQ